MHKSWLAGAAGLAALCLSTPLAAVEAVVESVRIDSFKGAAIGQPVDGMIWRGGLVMTSANPEFGGLSSLAFTGPDAKLAMVSDVGNFVSGQLLHDEAGRPLQMVGVDITPIQNSKGAELPRAFAKDAEALDTIIRDGVPAAVRVGFENLTRVADFELDGDGRPTGAAKEIAIPDWLTQLRTNRSLESVCIAPPTSPVAGSTLLLPEAALGADGHLRAFLLGNRDRGELFLIKKDGVDPTDCAFLPNGDLLVLERGTGLLSFLMQVRRIPAEQVKAGVLMDGPVILSASGGEIDNMEGLAVYPGPEGDIRIAIISDDNFNDWERNLWLEFSLPQG